jgi:prophage endopeptidase
MNPIPWLKVGKWLLIVAAVAGVIWWAAIKPLIALAHAEAGVAKAQTETAKANTKLAEYRADAEQKIAHFEVEARATEQRHAADLNRIARETKEQSQEAADAAYNRAVADVRAGKLRNVWSCPAIPAAGVPAITSGARQPDASTDDRGEAIGRVLRIAAECDAQVRGLQSVTQSDRKVTP